MNKSISKEKPENTAGNNEILQAISRISAEMSDLKDDLRFYVRKTETEMIHATYSGMENSTLEILSKNYEEEIREVMRIIAGDCNMLERCSATFSQIISDMILDYRKGELDNTKADEYRKTLAKMREEAPFSSCKNCFDRNGDILDKSIKSCGAFQNLFAGRRNEGEKRSVQDVDPEDIVLSYLEPLANRHRFRVMQELYYGPKSFSELSETTGLRGGNLLFHLEKLVSSSLILQKKERGSYVLSDKGAGALNVCTGLMPD